MRKRYMYLYLERGLRVSARRERRLRQSNTHSARVIRESRRKAQMGKARTAKTPNMRLREQREQRQLTQAALAEKLGVSTLTVGRGERGEAVPTPYALKKLCTLLEATPQALGFEQDKEKEAGALEPAEGEQPPQQA